jgi:DNA ligase-1
MRQPGSSYEAGRSGTLLKVKSFLDAEATVLRHQPGRGKLRGFMGALVASLPDGTTFAVGTGFSDRERADPPPVGSVITFCYQELSKAGVPRFPSFVRMAESPARRSRTRMRKP